MRDDWESDSSAEHDRAFVLKNRRALITRGFVPSVLIDFGLLCAFVASSCSPHFYISLWGRGSDKYHAHFCVLKFTMKSTTDVRIRGQID